VNEKEARSVIESALKNVNWLNFARVVQTLADGHPYGRFDNNYWRPNYKQFELDLPWMLDNVEDLCKALSTIKNEGANDDETT
jgi:hypothetical protein